MERSVQRTESSCIIKGSDTPPLVMLYHRHAPFLDFRFARFGICNDAHEGTRRTKPARCLSQIAEACIDIDLSKPPSAIPGHGLPVNCMSGGHRKGDSYRDTSNRFKATQSASTHGLEHHHGEIADRTSMRPMLALPSAHRS